MAGNSVTQQVLFELGVTGADGTITKIGNVALKFGAVAAAAGLVANKMAGAIKSADDFADAVKSSDIDMGRFLQTTKGLISGMGAYQNANKLQTAQVKITADQMDALGKKAVQMADKLGTDATQEFDKLTDAVIRANARGLVPYGVQLKTTGDKVKDQQIALDALTKSMGDYQVELGNTSEALEAFKKTAQVTTDIIVEAIGKNMADAFFSLGGGIANVNAGLQLFNTEALATKGRMAEWQFSWDGVWNAINSVNKEMLSYIGIAQALDFLGIGGDPDKIRYQVEQNLRKMAKIEEAGKQPTERQPGEGGRAPTEEELAKRYGTDEEILAGHNKILGRGKNGGAAKKKDIFTGFDTGLSGVDITDIMQGIDTPEEEAARQKAERIDALNQQAEDRWFERESAKMQTAEEFRAQEYASMNEWEQAKFDRQKEWDQMRKAEQVQTYAGGAAQLGAYLGQASAMTDKNSRKGFENMKRLQYAQAAMTLPQAIMNAWNSGMQFGPASIVMAPTMVAATTALGVAQIAQIESQKFGGGTSKTSASAPSVSVPSGGLNNYGSGASSGGGTTIHNNIIVDGTMIHSTLIKANDGASQRGERSFTTAA